MNLFLENEKVLLKIWTGFSWFSTYHMGAIDFYLLLNITHAKLDKFWIFQEDCWVKIESVGRVEKSPKFWNKCLRII